MALPGRDWPSCGCPLGNSRKPLDRRIQAVSMNPDLARTQTVLGFAYLTQIETKRSKDAFLKSDRA